MRPSPHTLPSHVSETSRRLSGMPTQNDSKAGQKDKAQDKVEGLDNAKDGALTPPDHQIDDMKRKGPAEPIEPAKGDDSARQAPHLQDKSRR